MKKVTRTFLIATSLFILIFPFAYFVFVYSVSHEMLKNGNSFSPGLSTKIYDRKNRLISELFDENRSYVRGDAIPGIVKNAFIAAEDSGFYSHTGIDISGILRAVMADITSGSFRQGGSTITQQLVKQLYTEREKTLKRKIVELLITMEFERRYTKDKILEMYLNQIYFGHGVYGVKSASRFYFQRSLDELGIPEAALLAAIPSAPNRYSPLINPRLAYERSRNIIYNMIYAGIAGKQEAADSFNGFWKEFLEGLRTRYPTVGVRNIKNDRAPFFTEYIRRILIKRYGEEKVYRGGLKVFTTLDIDHQEIAGKYLNEEIKRQNSLVEKAGRFRKTGIDWILAGEKAGRGRKKHERKRLARLYGRFRNDVIESALLASLLFDTGKAEETISRHIDARFNYSVSSRVQGAFVSLEPSTGAVTAMIGGAGSGTGNQLNRAVQSLRQPGSAFKAFIYGAGIESKKITLATPFDDLPVFFRGKRRDKDWSPSNYGSRYQGRVLARRAFASSLNTISILIYQHVGGGRIARFASRVLNIPKNRITVDPTLALGTTEVTPLEMASGFGVVANRGIRVSPFAIRSIRDKSGKEIYNGEESAKKSKKRILSPETSFLMTHLMRSVVDYGTAYSAVRIKAGFRGQGAGKTGTNTDFRDAWFVGFTPDLVVSVWIGCDSQKYTLPPGQSGSVVAAPVWGKFMKDVYSTRKKKWFGKAPAGITRVDVCKITGKLPVEGCPIRREYFLKETVPREKCDSDHSTLIDVFGPAKKKRKTIDRFQFLPVEKDEENSGIGKKADIDRY